MNVQKHLPELPQIKTKSVILFLVVYTFSRKLGENVTVRKKSTVNTSKFLYYAFESLQMVAPSPHM